MDNENTEIIEDQLLEEDFDQTAQDRILELEERNLLLLAEFQNFKKRSEIQINNAKWTGTVKALEALYSMCDIIHMKKTLTENSDDSELLDILENNLLENLNIYDIKPIKVNRGDKFDLNFHDAVSAVESDLESGMIINEISKGFVMGDRVCRHSKVLVSK